MVSQHGSQQPLGTLALLGSVEFTVPDCQELRALEHQRAGTIVRHRDGPAVNDIFVTTIRHQRRPGRGILVQIQSITDFCEKSQLETPQARKELFGA